MKFLNSIKNFAVNLYHREKSKKNPLLMLVHPIDTVEEMKEKRTGSVFWATVLLFLFTLSEIIVTVAKGFLFNTAKAEDFNLFYVLLRSCFIVLLFVIGNWSLCTLFDGEGRMVDIYVYTCYCLTPMIAYRIFDTIFSNVVTSDEYVFITMVNVCTWIWFLSMLIFAMKRLHNYTFGKTLLSLIFSVVAMAIIFFLLYLLLTLIQQLATFVMTIYTELLMRSMS